MQAFRSRRIPRGRAAPSSLLPLARMARAGQVAHLRYRLPSGGISERDATVLGLGWRRNGWVLSALCHLRATYLLLRVDRIVTAERAGRRADAHAHARFDARAFAATDLACMGSLPAMLVTLRMARGHAPLAPVLFPFALTERLPSGAVLCHFRTDAPDHAAAFALSLGALAEPHGSAPFVNLVEWMAAHA